MPTAAADPAWHPHQFPQAPELPGYFDLTPIAIGGMGAVYRAVQRGTERVVAVKFVHPAWAADGALLRRFGNEARALARVKHAGVVQVFEVGGENGPPYFSMEFVAGGTLAKRIRAGPVALRDAVSIMAAVADAVSAAHACGLLHRDIKPGNVLLAEDGTPKVSDFGLAKFLETSDGPTITGAILGTPSYMAPEQAAGRVDAIDECTDVYGIGATLYELLTGRPPFKGADYAATLKLVVEQDVTAPRSLRAEIPAELEAVCLKCLEKEPANRYPTARAVGEELNRWLDGKPTATRPRTAWGRARRWARRHPVSLTVSLLVPVILVVAGVSFALLDPRRQIERSLDRGKPVTLVGPTGKPRWHHWVHGEVVLTETDGGDGSWGFQTNGLSILELCPDPRTGTFTLSAELRQLRALSDDAGVGVYVGDAGPTGIARRWIGFEFDDFWRQAELALPDLKAKHGIMGCDYLSLRLPASEELSSCNQGRFLFPPANAPRNPWRQFVVEVSAQGVAVGWRTDDGKLVPALNVPAADIHSRTALHQEASNTVGAGPVPPWQPRAGLGIYAKDSVVTFRSVILTPRMENARGEVRAQ